MLLTGVIFLAAAQSMLAQQESAPSGGTFYGPPLLNPFATPKVSPPLNLFPPGTQPATAPVRLSPAPTRCAVPLIEMKKPAASDAITTPARATVDPMATAPPAPACAIP